MTLRYHGPVPVTRLHDAALRAVGLHKSYTTGTLTVPVLRGVDVSFPAGQLTGPAGLPDGRASTASVDSETQFFASFWLVFGLWLVTRA